MGHPMALRIPLGTHTMAGAQAESGQIWDTRPQPFYFLASHPMKEEFWLTIYSSIGIIIAIHNVTFLIIDPNSPSARLHEPESLGHPMAQHSVVLSFPRSQNNMCSHSINKSGHLLCVSKESAVTAKDLVYDFRNHFKGLDILALLVNYL